MKRILLLTDSEGLPRPTIGLKYEDTYCGLLESEYAPINTCQMAAGGYTIGHMYEHVLNTISYLPDKMFDLAIIHLGIVDCAPRAKAHYPKLLKRYRPLLQTWFGYYQYTPLEEFTETWARLLKEVSRDSQQVITIGIAPVLPSVERHSPGIGREIARYNEIIKPDIDTSGIPLYCLTEDAHLNAHGHKWLWERIWITVNSLTFSESSLVPY